MVVSWYYSVIERVVENTWKLTSASGWSPFSSMDIAIYV
jgi:hypothetical protein